MVQVENMSLAAPRHPEFPSAGAVRVKEGLPCCDDLTGLKGVIMVLFNSKPPVARLCSSSNLWLLRIWEIVVGTVSLSEIIKPHGT